MRQFFPDKIKLADDKIVCYLIDLGLFDHALLSECLNDDELNRAKKLKLDSKKQQFIITRALLRELLSRCLVDTRPEAIVFQYNDHGKPLVNYRYVGKSIYFNVSHSNNLALLAFTLGCEVGVDIEAINSNTDYLSLAKRFFSDAEYQQLLSIDPELRLDAFYRIWTRKEAFIKGEGSGVSFGLDQFSVPSEEKAVSVPITVNSDKQLKAQWYSYNATKIPDYESAIAATGKDLHIVEHVIVH